MTIAKRRTRKKHSKANIPHSNKEAAGECFRHVCSINTRVLLTTETKTQSLLQVRKGLHINEPPGVAGKHHVSRAQNTGKNRSH